MWATSFLSSIYVSEYPTPLDLKFSAICTPNHRPRSALLFLSSSSKHVINIYTIMEQYFPIFFDLSSPFMQYLNSNNPYPRTLNLEETLKIIIEQNYFFFLIIQASHDSPRKEINLTYWEDHDWKRFKNCEPNVTSMISPPPWRSTLRHGLRMPLVTKQAHVE